MMANEDIKSIISKKGLRYYEVAEALGVERTSFSHWLQTELPEEKKKPVLDAIEKASEQHEDKNFSPKNKNNYEIRKRIQKSRIKYYEIAAALGITYGTFSQWMLMEMTSERRERTLEAIERLEQEKAEKGL